jgi:alginate O-acetyltransferase complex protein AlgI
LSVWFNRILIFHLVCLSWIFFRAPSMESAFAMLSGIDDLVWIPEYATAFTFLAAFTIPMFLLDLVNERRGEEYLFERLSPNTRAAVAMSLVLVAVMFAGSSANAFIYFQF